MFYITNKSVFCLFFFSQKYLKDYYFKNAKTANFWESLANVCFNFVNIAVTNISIHRSIF